MLAQPEASQAGLGYLVLREQWRTRGNGALGSFQRFLMNGIRKNGENLFLSLSCGAQGSERERYSGYPAHKTRGILSELLVAPSSPHPSIIHCQLQGWHGRAHNATHSFCPIQFPEAWAGLLWGFFFFPLFFILKFPRWTLKVRLTLSSFM